MIQQLLDAGFKRVIVLDAAQCGIDDASRAVLALWPYEAEENPPKDGAWIHPYYFASQQAYCAAAMIAGVWADRGVRHRDDVLLKPIMNRLPCMTTGRNTLSYAEGMGSRFHVQVLSTMEVLPVTHQLTDDPHGLHCGDCRRCMDACPTGAINEAGYHREKCLRNWMMSGQPIPESMREGMENRLLGCDECQRCCPHNPQPTGTGGTGIVIKALLDNPRQEAESLRSRIGANLALTNRVLGQACLVAGCSGDSELTESLLRLARHPSPVVAEHARWAAERLEKCR